MLDPNVPLAPSPYDKDYEITDAMFGAFRSPGGMPFFWKLFGWMTLFSAIIGAILIPQSIGVYVDLIVASVEIENDPSTPPGEILGSLGKFFGVWGLFMLLYFIIVALVRAAFYRCYFFGDEGGVFPFKFGQDELRQFLAILGFFALFIVALFGVTLILIILAVIFGAVIGTNSAVFLALLLVVTYLAMIVISIWFAVRFSPAGALTALRGRTHVVAARHVSKNRFWALFGSILVAGLIGYVVNYVATISGLLLAFSGLGGSDIFVLMTGTDPEAMLEAIEKASETASFKLSSIFAIALVSAGYAFYSLILAGPQAFFTKQWAKAHQI